MTRKKEPNSVNTRFTKRTQNVGEASRFVVILQNKAKFEFLRSWVLVFLGPWLFLQNKANPDFQTKKNETNLPEGHRVGVRLHRTKTDKLQNKANFLYFQPKNKECQKKQSQFLLDSWTPVSRLWTQITKLSEAKSRYTSGLSEAKSRPRVGTKPIQTAGP